MKGRAGVASASNDGPGARRLLRCVAVALFLLVGAACASASRAVPAAAGPVVESKRCARGVPHAVIGGRHVCLRAGQKCSRRHDGRYHRYGFHCHGARLTRPARRSPPALPPSAAAAIVRIEMPGVRSHSAAEDLAIGDGAVWVGFHREAFVARVDPTANRVVATVKTPSGRSCGIGVGGGTVWVGHCGVPAPGRGLSQIDAFTNRLVTTLPTPGTFSPTLGAGSVWVIAGDPRATKHDVWKIDPVTGGVVAKIPLPSRAFVSAFAFGSLWVGHVEGGGVSRVDPAANTVASRIPTGTDPVLAVGADEAALWVLPAHQARIYRIDPATNATTSFALPAAPGDYFGQWSLAVGGGSVWARTGDTRIARLDGRTGELLGTVYVGAYVSALAYGFGSLWASVPDLNQVWRIAPR